MPSIPSWALETGPKTEDPADWRKWWQYNQDAYLDLSGRLHGSVSRSDAADAPGGTLDYDGYVREKLDRSLRTLIEQAGGTNAYMSSAVLALARISPDAPDADLDPYLSFYLREGTQDLRGMAAVALAVQGRESAYPALRSLLADDAYGRELSRADRVSPVVRAFAAYALGLYGARSTDARQQTEIVEQLFGVLRQKDVGEDVKVAAVVSLGLVPLAEKMGPPDCDCGGIGHEPQTSRLSQIAWLCDYLGDDKEPVSVRVHVPTAIARLVEGMSEPVREMVGDALLPIVEKATKEFGAVRQSCVIALGEISRAGETALDKRIRSTLQRTAGFGEEASRRLALVALARGASRGEIRDSAIRDAAGFLELSLASSQNRVRPWAAVGLGVLAHQLAAAGQKVPGDIVAALRSGLDKARTSDEFAACALGAGLTRDPQLADSLLAGLASQKEDYARGMAALALGLVHAEQAIPVLQALLDERVHRPELHGPAALALGLLGDDQLVPHLKQKLADATDGGARASYARTLGAIGSPEALDALVSLVQEPKHGLQARTAALQALGTLAGREDARWSALLGPNQNYLAPSFALTNKEGTGVLDLD